MREGKPLPTRPSCSPSCRSLRKKSQEVGIQLVLTMDDVHNYRPSSSSLSMIFLSSSAQRANRSPTIIHHRLFFSQDLVSLLFCLIFFVPSGRTLLPQYPFCLPFVEAVLNPSFFQHGSARPRRKQPGAVSRCRPGCPSPCLPAKPSRPCRRRKHRQRRRYPVHRWPVPWRC